MTINYDGSFVKALFTWKGSVWKAIWIELLIYVSAYFTLRFTLHFVVYKGHSEALSPYVELFAKNVMKLPLDLFMGFFINQAVSRWWGQVSLLPWPDEIMAHASSILHQNDDDTRSRRRTVGRYIVLSIILVYRHISTQISKRFPTLDRLQESGLLTSEERQILEKTDDVDIQHEIPLHWIHEIIRSKTDSTQGSLVFSINSYRNQLRSLTHYNKVNFPLVYTQIATIAVYGLFMFCLMGNMFLERDHVETAIPLVTILRFVYNVGWLKVAQHLRNPFGDDDVDVDLTEWIDRHIRLVYTVADHVKQKYPCDSWTHDKSSFFKVMEMFPKVDHEESSLLKQFKKLFREASSMITVRH